MHVWALLQAGLGMLLIFGELVTAIGDIATITSFTQEPYLMGITVQAAMPGVFGDPHLKTWKGQTFDYHGECDLVLAQGKQFGQGIGLDIHIRTTIRNDWSYVSAAALRIGEDILEVHSFGKYYLNGVEGAPIPKEFGGYPFSHKQQKKRPDRFIVYTDYGKVEVRVFKDFVSVGITSPTVEGFGDVVGLMGSFGKGEWLLRDGETITDDPVVFGNEWQVQTDHEHQLFLQDGPVVYPDPCRLPLTTSSDHRRLEEE